MTDGRNRRSRVVGLVIGVVDAAWLVVAGIGAHAHPAAACRRVAARNDGRFGIADTGVSRLLQPARDPHSDGGAIVDRAAAPRTPWTVFLLRIPGPCSGIGFNAAARRTTRPQGGMGLLGRGAASCLDDLRTHHFNFIVPLDQPLSRKWLLREMGRVGPGRGAETGCERV